MFPFSCEKDIFEFLNLKYVIPQNRIDASSLISLSKKPIKLKINTETESYPIIIGSNLDTTNFLTADESYKLVTNDSSVKDEIAAGLYFKDIGSRKGSTVAQSNIEYSNATDNVKTVYRSKATTDIRKLVTEGYLKINRTTQNVSIATEKAGL